MSDSAWDDPIFELEPSPRRRPWGLVGIGLLVVGGIGLLVVGGLAVMFAVRPPAPLTPPATTASPEVRVLVPVAPVIVEPPAATTTPPPAPAPRPARVLRRDDLLGDRL